VPKRHLPTLAVVAFAVIMAALIYRDFLGVHRTLWDNSTHDRNAHYLFALRLVTDAEHLNVFRLLYDLYATFVYPPLHGSLAAAAMLVGGRDYRVAVLPNVAAWAGTVVFAFLAARRAAPRGSGLVAGLVAVLFVAASPAHRAYATDVMLESLGACLTLVVLYAYLVAVQSEGESPWPGRWLALALTTLFLHKYNYWTLCVMTIVLAELVRRPGDYWRYVRDVAGRVEWRAFLLAQVRSPLNYALAIALLLLAGIKVSGWQSLTVVGREVQLSPPYMLITVAYVIFFVRLAAWFWRLGRFELKRFDPRFQQLVRWHAAPVAVWFLLPKHLGYFLWFLSPANANPDQKTNLLDGLAYYWPRIVEEYHAASWCAVLAGVLIVPAVLLARRLRPGGVALLLLFALGLLLTATHPNHKGRYVHSWVALGWLSAGLGAAALLYGPLSERLMAVRPWLSGAALVALACALVPALRVPAYAPEGGPHPTHLSLLDVTDSYLAEVEPSRRTTILAAVPIKPLAQWTYLERTGDLRRLEKNWYGYGAPGEGNREGFKTWLRNPPCDTLVFIDRLPGPGVGWEEAPDVALHAELRDLVLTQQVFQLAKQQDFPYHGCRVQVWTLRPIQTTQQK
jgi:hypothetical protein